MSNKNILNLKISLFIIGSLIVLSGCQILPNNSKWEQIGLEGKDIQQLVLANQYLYACAGSDGLWKKNILETKSEWEYLGMADTGVTNPYYGVLDVVVYPEDDKKIIITYSSYPGSKYTSSTYITMDGGENWESADSGLEYTYEGNTYHSTISQLVFYPEYILGGGRSGIFIKETINTPWSNELVSENYGAFKCVMICHQTIKDLVWMGGQGALSQPTLAFSIDGGFNWNVFDLDNLGYSEIDIASVNSIAFDPEDTNTIYIGLSDKIIKTENCGDTWTTPCDSCLGSNGLLVDPLDGSHLWSIDRTSFSESYNGCESWHEIEIPFQATIWDMVLDEELRVLYLGTERGIYCYNL